MVDEGVLGLGAQGVDIAPQVWRCWHVVIGFDDGGVDEGSRAVVVGEDDSEAPLAEVLAEVSHRAH